MWHSIIYIIFYLFIRQLNKMVQKSLERVYLKKHYIVNYHDHLMYHRFQDDQVHNTDYHTYQ